MSPCSQKKSECRHCPSFSAGIFSELSEDELVLLEGHKSIHEFKRKQIVFLEGDDVQGIFCIQSGKVKIYKTTGDGKQQILNIAQPGSLLGHSSLFTQCPHAFTAEALDDSQICFWNQEGFLSILQRNPPVALKLMTQLSAELNRAEEKVLENAYQSVRQRFAKFLLMLKDKFGVSESQGYRLDIYLSRQELAQAIGSTEETVVRLISEFHKDGFINIDKKNIFVIEPDKLLTYTKTGY